MTIVVLMVAVEKEHKHYNYIKLEIIYSSKQDQVNKLGFVLGRESNTEKCKCFNLERTE